MSKGAAALVALKLNQTEIAERLGTDQSFVSRVIRGERNPQVAFRKAAKEQFGIDWEAWDEDAEEEASATDDGAAA